MSRWTEGVEVVGARLAVRALHEHEGEGLDTEADDDGGEHEGLGHGIGVRRHEAFRARGDDRRPRSREPAHREDEEVRRVAEEGEAEDELDDVAAHHEVEPRRVEDADRHREEDGHDSSSASANRIASTIPRTTR